MPEPTNRLFAPLKIGSATLQNRLVMAPLTRFRATEDFIPTPLMEKYYAQRACVPGTLLITEATFISPQASGFPTVPGIYSSEQITAWKKVTDAVHEKGSYIYCQLWALGRAADPNNLKAKGLKVVSSSPVEMPGKTGGRVEEPEKPHALTEEEIWEFVKMYAQASKNAIEAGFDGVEIHAANGYLIDQFNQDTCNDRTDAWGGSVEKRSRFCIEVAKACVDAVGAEKVGIRLSPFSEFQGMGMKDPYPQFTDLATKLKELNLTYLHVVESRISGNADVEQTEKVDFLIDIWSKGPSSTPILIAGGFKPDSAKRAVNEEYAGKDVAIVFGRYFISNPDLVYRLKKSLELVDYDRDTFYKAGSPDGYTDYPFSKEFEAESAKL